MQFNDNSKEEYLEIWNSIKPEVKALNRSIHRKKNSRKFLFLLLALLIVRSAWFILVPKDIKIQAFEDRQNQQEMSNINCPTPIARDQHKELLPTVINSTTVIQNHFPNDSQMEKTEIEDGISVTLKSSSTNSKESNHHSKLITKDQAKENQYNPTPDLNTRKIILKEKKNSSPITLQRLPRLKAPLIEKIPSSLNKDKLVLVKGLVPIILPKNSERRRDNLVVFGGLSYIQKKLANKDKLVGLINYRNTTERTLYAQHFGIAITSHHRSNFTFSYGINYTSITEAFNASQTVIDTFLVDGIERILIQVDGSIKEIYGKASVQRTTINDYEYFHQYNLLELPFLVGYAKHWNSYQFGCQTGLLTNLTLSTKGKRLDIEGRKEPIERIGYEPTIGFGYYASLFLQKSISPNISLSIEPSLRIYPDISNEENYISQQYKLYGLNMNLIFKL